jgi:hypothetical protein
LSEELAKQEARPVQVLDIKGSVQPGSHQFGLTWDDENARPIAELVSRALTLEETEFRTSVIERLRVYCSCGLPDCLSARNFAVGFVSGMRSGSQIALRQRIAAVSGPMVISGGLHVHPAPVNVQASEPKPRNFTMTQFGKDGVEKVTTIKHNDEGDNDSE